MGKKKLDDIENESILQTLWENSPDAIVIIRQDGRILRANTKALLFFGAGGRISMDGLNVFDAILPEDQERARTNIGKIAKNEELQDAEYKLNTPDGSLLWRSVRTKLLSSPEDGEKKILIVLRDITDQKNMEEHLHSLAVTDDLTGLYNRRGFALAAEQELRHAFRRKEELTLLFFDIDNLKMINDTFGHFEGDRVVKSAAMALRSIFRESDIVARWGGDEFVVLALDVPSGRVPVLLKRLEKGLDQYNELNADSYALSFSMGIATYDSEKPFNLSEMVRIADKMMYKDKQEKKLSHSAILNYNRGEAAL
jgi:diguanylate cyclase (GGDEF)-like protein/PAS domain S-box-containing protein